MTAAAASRTSPEPHGVRSPGDAEVRCSPAVPPAAGSGPCSAFAASATPWQLTAVTVSTVTQGRGKPPEIFDRDAEWTELVRYAQLPQRGATLGVVSGLYRAKTLNIVVSSEQARSE
ncbi:hypothetical protein Abr02nite_79220 [Paractinoplanes brasiliensis]|nr:hypothetical protein Abr02nite_79220 [Actinoplanes brasiliensis]